MAYGFLFFKSAFSIFTVLLIIETANCQRAQPAQPAQQPSANPNLFTVEDDATEEGNDSVELDFVNLPGYGIIDDSTTLANGNFTCMFHLCYPTKDPKSDEIVFQRFSFLCSESGVFDQQNLVCVENGTAPTVCSESPSFYDMSNLKLVETLQQSSPGYFADGFDGESTANGTSISEQSGKPGSVSGTVTDAAAGTGSGQAQSLQATRQSPRTG